MRGALQGQTDAKYPNGAQCGDNTAVSGHNLKKHCCCNEEFTRKWLLLNFTWIIFKIL